MYIGQAFRVRPVVRRMDLFSVLVITLFLIGLAGVAKAQPFTQGFEDATFPPTGWTVKNQSTTVGSNANCWNRFTASPWAPQAGVGHAGANFNCTTGTNTISGWLITHQLTITNGMQLKFWTRTVANEQFPDRLEVRISTNGASTNTGATSTDVGDFTTVLLTVNPSLTLGVYPTTYTQLTATVSGIAGGSASGRFAFRYFVTDGGPTGDNSELISIDSIEVLAAAPVQHVVDTDGDGRTDYVVVRNTGGGPGGQITWLDLQGATAAPLGTEEEPEGTAVRGIAWGISTDEFVPEDYDGDNKTDIAVWRGGAPNNSFFYVIRSSDGTIFVSNFGQMGDDPSVVGDYDNDNKADVAVYRGGVNPGDQSMWFYRGTNANPGNNITFIPWGTTGDFPAPGDYDGDGRNDFVVQRNNGGGVANFWMRLANGTLNNSNLWGAPTDFIVPGDYDGDGKTDIAVARSIGGMWNWFIRPSSGAPNSKYNVWGASATDFLVQGDYDGDGRTDQAVWRSGVFLIKKSSGGTAGVPWGAAGDYPVANFNVH